MKCVLVLLCVVLVTGAEVSVQSKASTDQQPPGSGVKLQEFKLGDPRLCLQTDRNAQFNVQRFEVLPGTGWDNLQNEAKGQVIDFNYSRCLSTDDGRFLVPDQVFTIPIKESIVDTFAEYLDTWHNTSSTTSSSVNANAGLHISFVSVSGSFSREHTQIKKKQMEDKAVTVRVQLRYHRYKSQLQPDSQLHPAFKRRLLSIAASLQLNKTDLAYYKGQLLVRDFGTHVLTSITAGAGLVKTDFLKRDYVATQFKDKTKMLASASASFGSFFGMSGSYSHSTTTTDYKTYLSSLTHSYVTSHGGPLLKAVNQTVNDWTSAVDMELVAMDRSGDPLSFLVTEATLPEIPAELVFQVEKVVRKSIIQYYEINTHFGCTKLGSPNFRFSANFDDGSCEHEATNMTFGGVYQTCQVQGQYLNNNPCSHMTQVNPKTRGLFCPPQYTEVKLVEGRKTGAPESRRECHSCGLFGWFHCCDTRTYQATAVYTSYWCAGLGHLTPDSGYLFGGLFSSTQENPLTGNKGCPPSFYPQVFLDQQVCISDDFEIGTQYSVPFGGFISCSIGNPLAMPGVKPIGLQAANPDSLQAFMATNQNPAIWPKHCSRGYSQHLATIENGCEIRYCLKSGSLAGPNLPKVKLPPFHDKPDVDSDLETRIIFDAKTMTWYKQHQEEPGFGSPEMTWSEIWTSASGGRGYKDSGMEPGVAAVLGVIATLVCGVVAMIVLTAINKRRRARAVEGPTETQRLLSNSEESVQDNPSSNEGYGAANVSREFTVEVSEA